MYNIMHIYMNLGSTRENLNVLHVSNICADQTVHLRILVSTFVLLLSEII